MRPPSIKKKRVIPHPLDCATVSSVDFIDPRRESRSSGELLFGCFPFVLLILLSFVTPRLGGILGVGTPPAPAPPPFAAIRIVNPVRLTERRSNRH
jgi:hypothetical protein